MGVPPKKNFPSLTICQQMDSKTKKNQPLTLSRLSLIDVQKFIGPICPPPWLIELKMECCLFVVHNPLNNIK